MREVLNEIDWEGDFSDVKGQCLNPNVVVKWLNDEMSRMDVNLVRKEKDRQRRDPKGIIVARGTIEDVMDDLGRVNLEMFIKNLTTEPETIFDHNPKMEKSDVGRPQLTVNTGLPALVAIVYDQQINKFFSISTCPSAGACQIGCYARKGFYGMDESKTMKLTRRVNLLMNNPVRYKERIMAELEPLAQGLKDSSVGLKEKMQLVIRWNDAGDFFGQRYFDIAKEVTKELLDKGYNVKSYAYTKRGKYVLALNGNKDFVVNFSTDAHKKDVEMTRGAVESKQVKVSHRVPRSMFSDIFKKSGPHYAKSHVGSPIFAQEESPDILKDRIYKEFGKQFGFKRNSLLFTYELPREEGKKGQYNVIVLPTGDSDIPAQRQDVRVTFLLEH